MTVFIEKVVGDYLRAHPDITALGARVATKLPATLTNPWVRITLLDAPSDVQDSSDHLVSHLLQLDCYAGSTRDGSQQEAHGLYAAVRDALSEMAGVHGGAVLASARFTNVVFLPDAAMEPARDRYIITADIPAHG